MAHLQMVLPDPIFQGLPESIFLRNGRRPRLDHCTVSEVDDNIKLRRTRADNDPHLAQMEAVSRLMHEYSAENRGITWAEVKRREAAKRERG